MTDTCKPDDLVERLSLLRAAVLAESEQAGPLDFPVSVTLKQANYYHALANAHDQLTIRTHDTITAQQAEIERLRKLVERAQGIVGEGHCFWHEQAELALKGQQP